MSFHKEDFSEIEKDINNLLNKEAMISEEVSKVLEKIKAHPDVLAIYLFGSHAKGEATQISDIDIAVIIENPTEESEAEIGSLYSQQIDLVLFHRLPLHIKAEVFKHGVELFVRNEEKLAEIKFLVLREYLEMERIYRSISAEVLK